MNSQVSYCALSLDLFQSLSEQDSECIRGGRSLNAFGSALANLKTFQFEGDPDRPIVTGRSLDFPGLSRFN